VLHLRPLEWPVITAHLAMGWLLAWGFRWPDGYALAAMAVWVIGLNGGTLALNSAFDRDTDDIAYLRAPPPAPRGLALLGIALMLGGLAITWQYGAPWRVLYGACVVLSVAYSVPPLRLKRVAGVDWAINLLGFGAFTPLAGWAITGRSLEPAHMMLLWAFAPLFGALYPLTQLYQLDSDRAKGDRTLASLLGVRHSLRLALFLVGVGFAMIVGVAIRTGWPSLPGLRWSALAIAFAAWLAVLLPWFREGPLRASREHQQAMYHALAAWVLTDVAVILAWVA
jgi:4-hydroxybenzoate polyprenyltransferase